MKQDTQMVLLITATQPNKLSDNRTRINVENTKAQQLT
jgi:hypothetical protein